MMLLKDKTILVMGVANERSIAWNIVETLAHHGANIIFTYQNDKFKKRVVHLQDSVPNIISFPCDVRNEDEIKALFSNISTVYDRLDGIVHSIAYANAQELEGHFSKVSRHGFLESQNLSTYSLISITREALPYLKLGGSIIALTYLGSTKVIPNYHMMGVAKASLESTIRYLASELGTNNIRVNGISSGPIKTLSAQGIKDFNLILQRMEEKSPLKKLTDAVEIADTSVFLLSPLSRAITGEIIHVDHGYHILGL